MPDLAEHFVLGCSQIGGLYRVVDDTTATRTLEAAWEAGVRQFDTAPHYGAGLSERRLGAFLRQLPRDEYVVSTKVGRRLVPTAADTEGVEGFFGGDPNTRVRDDTAAGVVACIEESLERLGLDRVDTVYVHDSDDVIDQTVSETMPALVALRDQGVVSHVGAGMNHAEPLVRIVEETDADTIMVAGRFTLLERQAAAVLLPACQRRGVSVVAAGVFNGGLMADPRPGASFDYSDAPPAVVARAIKVRDLCFAAGISPLAAAIHFPFRSPAVVKVAVGCRGDRQVASNISAFDTVVPDSLWDDIDVVLAED